MRVPPAFADGETHAEDFRRMRRHVEGHGLQLTVLHCGNLPQAGHRLRPGGARASGPQLGADRARDRGRRRPPHGHHLPGHRPLPHPFRDRARGGPPEHLPAGGAGGRRGALHGARGTRGGAHPGRRDVGQSGLVLPARRARRRRGGGAHLPAPGRPARCPPCWRGRRASPAASRTTTASSTSPPGRPTRCSSARAAWPRWGWTSTRRSAPWAAGQDRAGALPGHPGHAGGLRGGLHRRGPERPPGDAAHLQGGRVRRAVHDGPHPAPGPALRGLARARLRQRVHQGPAEHRRTAKRGSRGFTWGFPGARAQPPDLARRWGHRQNTRQRKGRDR